MEGPQRSLEGQGGAVLGVSRLFGYPSSNPAKDNNKKVPTNNERKIINFEANFFDEITFSGFLGQKWFISTVKQTILGLLETLSYENYQK